MESTEGNPPTNTSAGCQLMVTWGDSTQNNKTVYMGTPFFRQYAVAADFSTDSPMLYFQNQTELASMYFLPEPTQQINPPGRFKGIVAFVIVLVALAGFMFIAWSIWMIHQKLHARDMDWTPDIGVD